MLNKLVGGPPQTPESLTGDLPEFPVKKVRAVSCNLLQLACLSVSCWTVVISWPQCEFEFSEIATKNTEDPYPPVQQAHRLVRGQHVREVCN